MKPALSAEQDRRLVWNLRKWCRILDETAKAVGEFGPNLLRLGEEMDFSHLNQDQFRQLRSVIFGVPADVHMVAICLRQVNEYVEQFKQSRLWTAAIKEKGRLFQKLFAAKDIIDLRDVLEHSAEYVDRGCRSSSS
jgi:hypothetical protein